jgi:hypothetical protein
MMPAYSAFGIQASFTENRPPLAAVPPLASFVPHAVSQGMAEPAAATAAPWPAVRKKERRPILDGVEMWVISAPEFVLPKESS